MEDRKEWLGTHGSLQELLVYSKLLISPVLITWLGFLENKAFMCV